MFRGAAIAGYDMRYWAVEDTFIDVAATQPAGASYSLQGGPGRLLLIRFANLQRVVGRRKVVKASLVLTQESGEPASISSVGKVLAGWGEGSMVTLKGLMSKPASPTTPTQPPPPSGAATWKERRQGYLGWQQPGATGAQDVQLIRGVKSSNSDHQVTITGLEDAVQGMIDRPDSNYGFSLNFSASCEFDSSKSPMGRPKLVLELADPKESDGADLSIESITSSPESPKPGQEVVWTAHLRNVGKKAANDVQLTWITDDRPGVASPIGGQIDPGQEATVTVNRTYKDSRFARIGACVTAKGDENPSNDELVLWETAKPISLGGTVSEAQGWVRTWNEEIAPQSRFSFAPNGVETRVRLQSSAGPAGFSSLVRQIGLPTVLAAPTLSDPAFAKRKDRDMYPGLQGFGDTRFEGAVPGPLYVPNEPSSSVIWDQPSIEATGLLSSFEVASLQGPVPLPKLVVMRALDSADLPLSGIELTLTPVRDGKLADRPEFTVKTSSSGTVILPASFTKLDPNDSQPKPDIYLVTGIQGGSKEITWLKLWQLAVASKRSGSTTVVADIHLNLSAAPSDTTVDLALDRFISDSKADAPAKLLALIDGNPATETELPGGIGSWVEIDLGRDRTISEIRIDSTKEPWRKFDIVVYATGQQANEGYLWAKESDWDWSSSVRNDATSGFSVAYRNQPQRFRYIRIINKANTLGIFGAIHVYPVQNKN